MNNQYETDDESKNLGQDPGEVSVIQEGPVQITLKRPGMNNLLSAIDLVEDMDVNELVYAVSSSNPESLQKEVVINPPFTAAEAVSNNTLSTRNVTNCSNFEATGCKIASSVTNDSISHSSLNDASVNSTIALPNIKNLEPTPVEYQEMLMIDNNIPNNGISAPNNPAACDYRNFPPTHYTSPGLAVASPQTNAQMNAQLNAQLNPHQNNYPNNHINAHYEAKEKPRPRPAVVGMRIDEGLNANFIEQSYAARGKPPGYYMHHEEAQQKGLLESPGRYKMHYTNINDTSNFSYPSSTAGNSSCDMTAKELHNRNEKARRADLKKNLNSLSNMLPTSMLKKPEKSTTSETLQVGRIFIMNLNEKIDRVFNIRDAEFKNYLQLLKTYYHSLLVAFEKRLVSSLNCEYVACFVNNMVPVLNNFNFACAIDACPNNLRTNYRYSKILFPDINLSTLILCQNQCKQSAKSYTISYELFKEEADDEFLNNVNNVNNVNNASRNYKNDDVDFVSREASKASHQTHHHHPHQTHHHHHQTQHHPSPQFTRHSYQYSTGINDEMNRLTIHTTLKPIDSSPVNVVAANEGGLRVKYSYPFPQPAQSQLQPSPQQYLAHCHNQPNRRPESLILPNDTKYNYMNDEYHKHTDASYETPSKYNSSAAGKSDRLDYLTIKSSNRHEPSTESEHWRNKQSLSKEKLTSTKPSRRRYLNHSSECITTTAGRLTEYYDPSLDNTPVGGSEVVRNYEEITEIYDDEKFRNRKRNNSYLNTEIEFEYSKFCKSDDNSLRSNRMERSNQSNVSNPTSCVKVCNDIDSNFRIKEVVVQDMSEGDGYYNVIKTKEFAPVEGCSPANLEEESVEQGKKSE